MSRQQHASNQSVSLFPFLAVLICAMGALIFLLIVTTRRIRHQAVTRAYESKMESVKAEQPNSTLPLLVIPKPESVAVAVPKPNQKEQQWKAIVARLQAEREQKHIRLKGRQQIVQAVQGRAAMSANELSKTEKQVQFIASNSNQNGQMEKAVELEHLMIAGEIDQLKKRIERVRRNNANANSKYTFIPFDGRTGTTRRPILIECTENSVRFIPEDIAVTPADLNGFTVDYNPLLAGAKALVQYWTLWNRIQPNPENEPEPYVLLIVRPSGSVAFYVARKLLSKVGVRYGYELVEEDMEFELPDVDLQAQSACRSAVEKVLAERERLVKSLPGGQSSRGQLRLNKDSGRFELEGMPGKSPNRRSRNSSGRNNLQANNGKGGNANRFGSRESGTGHGKSGSHSNEGKFGSSNGKSAIFPAEKRFANGFDNFGNSRFSKRNSTGKIGNGRFVGSNAAKTSSASSLSGDRLASRGVFDKSGKLGTANGLGDKNGGKREKNGRDLNSKQSNSDRNTNPEIEQNRKDRSKQTKKNQEATDESETGRGNSPEGSEFSLGGHGKDFGTGFGKTGSKQTAATGKGEKSNGQNKRSSKQSEGSDNSSSNGSSQDPNNFSGGAGGSGSDPASEGGGIPTFSRTFGKNPKQGNSRPTLVGKQWGIAKPRASIGFERKVAIEVFTNHVVIGDKFAIPAGQGESRDELVNQVVSAMDQHARSWGSPPGNFYWVPSVQFIISPGGNRHYERLHPQLRRLGLHTSVKLSLESTDSTLRRK